MTNTATPAPPTHVVVEFCGEQTPVGHTPFTIGRDADVSLDDDNRFLHRHLCRIDRTDRLWTLSNVGGRLGVRVSDDAGLVDAHLAPGASVPLVFATTVVRCTAGPTTYEFDIRLGGARYEPATASEHERGDPTHGDVAMTPDQLRLILALAEPALRSGGRAAAPLPSSSEAAQRLGWTLTRFNRKLDHVCLKLEDQGLRGLHGAPGQLAAHRRSRLVEYALASRLVTRDDLSLIETDHTSDSS